MPVLRHALIYLAAIFALGFVLVTIRTLWLARRLAARRPWPSRGGALLAGQALFALLPAQAWKR